MPELTGRKAEMADFVAGLIKQEPPFLYIEKQGHWCYGRGNLYAEVSSLLLISER
jgi:hypothetical protein